LPETDVDLFATLRSLARLTESLPGRAAVAALLVAAAAGCSTLPATVPARAADSAGSPTAPAAPAAAVSTATPAAAVPTEAAPVARTPDALAALIALNEAPASAPATVAGPGASTARPPAAAPAAPAPEAATPPPPEPVAATPAAVAPRDDIDVWERIRRGFAIPDLTTKLADNRTQWYAGQPDYMDRMAQRASMYLFHIVEEIEKRGMPTELALLPFVESAMQPEAVSSAKAAGLWQFIPSTGKLYALEQNLWHDQRRDIVESTRAALDYLQKLYGDFGDWHLALAAYNWGEGAVARAIARNKAQRKPTDYSSLRMPKETQYYVPKLQAIKNIVREPARYGIALPAIRNEPYFVAVSKERDIDVETAARLAEMPLDEFRALNPGFNRPVIVGAAQPNLLLPAHRADTFRANLAAWTATGQPLASWTTYTLQKNETLAQVAKRADISETKLREANRIPPRYRLAPGSTILVPRDDGASEDIAPALLDASFALVPDAPNLRQITYKVRRGETLNSVARRWQVQPEEIVAWNQLRSHSLFAGQRLTLTVARGPAKAAAKPVRAQARPARPAASAASAGAARTQQKPPAATAKPTVQRAAGSGTPAAASRSTNTAAGSGAPGRANPAR
jgi:membrane-bound lytic murein transglycosylase D